MKRGLGRTDRRCMRCSRSPTRHLVLTLIMLHVAHNSTTNMCCSSKKSGAPRAVTYGYGTQCRLTFKKTQKSRRTDSTASQSRIQSQILRRPEASVLMGPGRLRTVVIDFQRRTAGAAENELMENVGSSASPSFKYLNSTRRQYASVPARRDRNTPCSTQTDRARDVPLASSS
jgi:hypothetical protein